MVSWYLRYKANAVSVYILFEEGTRTICKKLNGRLKHVRLLRKKLIKAKRQDNKNSYTNNVRHLKMLSKLMLFFCKIMIILPLVYVCHLDVIRLEIPSKISHDFWVFCFRLPVVGPWQPV